MCCTLICLLELQNDENREDENLLSLHENSLKLGRLDPGHRVKHMSHTLKSFLAVRPLVCRQICQGPARGINLIVGNR